MKRIFGIAAGLALLAMSALAQDAPKVEQMKLELERILVHSKMMSAGGGVMGRSVKGAPYSGQEITESTQVLGDGTRIRNESRAMVYRDSEGRVRRETGDFVTIWDPVASENYTLDTKNMTATKSPLVTVTFARPTALAVGAVGRGAGYGPDGSVSVKDGIVTVTRDGKTETFPVGPDGSWVSPDGKLRGYSGRVTSTGGSGGTSYLGTKEIEIVHSGDHKVGTLGPLAASDLVRFDAATAGLPVMVRSKEAPNLKTEELGEQIMEGVKVRGTRHTNTLEAGAIGNDRRINTMLERWFSDDLQTEVMTRRSDPRTGEQTFRLANINRGEQAAYLFQVPSGYTMKDLRK